MEKKSKLNLASNFDKADYAHRKIYTSILNNPAIKREIKRSGVELDEVLIHIICEHSRKCVADWITEKVPTIKIPYLGKILIKPYRELFETKINNLLRRGLITREEATRRKQEIIQDIVKERKKIEQLTGSRYGRPRASKPEKFRLKITFNKDKPTEDTK